jgi:hypothetical protein
MPRVYLPEAEKKRRAWRAWRSIWSWGNVLLGGASTALAAVVAANTKAPFLTPENGIIAAVIVPVLTFLLTTLKPQANATAFETASREIEKAIVDYSADPKADDKLLSDAIQRGIDLLNKVSSS